MSFRIRRSKIEDLPELMVIYREAREIMLSCGNVNQWAEGYPTEEMIRRDISLGQGYVMEKDGCAVGAFALIFGPDPTYGTIEDGCWIDDRTPYATIHRLASRKSAHGVAQACFEWCGQQSENLRVDTHEDNVIMLHCIRKASFTRCGIIHLLNGAPRVAFQRIQFSSCPLFDSSTTAYGFTKT